MDTPSAYTIQTAVQKVLYLPELLEFILSHVPWSDLFVLQRVNSTFQRTISDSRNLQTRMELNNLPPPDTFTDLTEADDFIGPLLSEFVVCSNRIINARITSRRGDKRRIKCHISHAIVAIEGEEGQDGSKPRSWGESGESGLAHPSAHPSKTEDRVAKDKVENPVIRVNPEGSWRRLRLSIVPCELSVALKVDICYGPTPYVFNSDDSSLKTYHECTTLHADQMTYGDLADVMQEATRRSTEEHLRIWRGLSGRQRIGLGPERFVASAIGGKALIEKWRT